jgi:hypothetical protein
MTLRDLIGTEQQVENIAAGFASSPEMPIKIDL